MMQPLLTLVTSFFDIVSKNFVYENVFNYLKTGLTNIEDDDEYETVADAFINRLQDFFEINEQ